MAAFCQSQPELGAACLIFVDDAAGLLTDLGEFSVVSGEKTVTGIIGSQCFKGCKVFSKEMLVFSCLDWLAETGSITRTEKDGVLFWSLR